MPVRADVLPEPAVPSPPPGLVTIGRYDQRPGYRVHRPHGSDSWLFTWTTAGHGSLRQGATGTTAGAGDLVVLGPGVPHRYGVGPGAGHWAFWWTHCRGRPSWDRWLRPYALGDGVYAVRPARSRDRIASAFRRMLADARWTGDGEPPGGAEPGAGVVAVAHGAAARELALCSLEEIVLLATARAERGRPGTDARVGGDQRLRPQHPGV
ncbi:AraC family ligand binding domain-containing protein, partial [Streptomyces fagopyri]